LSLSIDDASYPQTVQSDVVASFMDAFVLGGDSTSTTTTITSVVGLDCRRFGAMAGSFFFSTASGAAAENSIDVVRNDLRLFYKLHKDLNRHFQHPPFTFSSSAASCFFK
jgi:hypothetical protein